MAKLGEHPPMISPKQMVKHMREMIKDGMTDQEIIATHPEIKKFFSGDDNGQTTESSEG